MKSRWKGCWAFRMGQPCFWLPAILIFSAGNCKKHLSYTFPTPSVPRALLFLPRNRTICLHLYRHLSLHAQDLGASFALHWVFLCSHSLGSGWIISFWSWAHFLLQESHPGLAPQQIKTFFNSFSSSTPPLLLFLFPRHGIPFVPLYFLLLPAGIVRLY